MRGRADGYDPAAKRLEEIKTYRGRLDSVRENHRAAHWAQAKVYGHLLCQARGLPGLTVALVYFNVATEEETMLAETHPAAELEASSTRTASATWPGRGRSRRTGARDAALEALRFPHEFRGGQRELAVAAYRKARDGGCLLAQAPTGIGKTLGTLFPLLKAAPEAGLDKLFFLAAKGPGRALALQALDTLNAQPAAPGLRVLELQARDKLCEHPDKACHGESCPLARGFTTACRGPRRRAGARPHGRRRAAPGRGGARRLPLLPGAGIDALERRGGG